MPHGSHDDFWLRLPILGGEIKLVRREFIFFQAQVVLFPSNVVRRVAVSAPFQKIGMALVRPPLRACKLVGSAPRDPAQERDRCEGMSRAASRQRAATAANRKNEVELSVM